MPTRLAGSNIRVTQIPRLVDLCYGLLPAWLGGNTTDVIGRQFVTAVVHFAFVGL